MLFLVVFIYVTNEREPSGQEVSRKKPINQQLPIASAMRREIAERAGASEQTSYNDPMLIDTHAHLDFPDFANDLDDVIRRAEDADVRRIITIGTSIESSRRAIALTEKYPSVYAAIGVHPSHVEEAQDDVITPLRDLAKNPRVVAIGETGLDYHRLPSEKVAKEKQVQVMTALRTETDEEIEAQIRDGAYKSKQASLFQQQLDLAAELGLNVVIHQRDAWEDTLEVLRAYTGKVHGVFHCFGGSLDQAKEVLDLNHLVSFTGIVTFKNGVAVQQVATDIPLWKFMVETDCPFLAPAPFRGKRCEPAYTRIVAEAIATSRGVPLNEIAEATTETADQFFRFNRA
jgi:TatD DNase family protein